MNNIKVGKWWFPSKDVFVQTMYSCALFIPFAICLYKSIRFNKVEITNKKIYIYKGVTGISITVPISDLKGFYIERHVNRGYRAENINFWGKSGERIRSGALHMDDQSLKILADVIETDLGLPQLKPLDILQSGETIKRVKGQNIKVNLFSALITASPFIISLILALIFYMPGFR